MTTNNRNWVRKGREIASLFHPGRKLFNPGGVNNRARNWRTWRQ